MECTKIVPTPSSISTPRPFNELVKLLLIFEARLFAWSATPCLSYPAAATYHQNLQNIVISHDWSWCIQIPTMGNNQTAECMNKLSKDSTNL